MTIPSPAHRPNAVGIPVAPLSPGPLRFGEILGRGFSSLTRNPRPVLLWLVLMPLAVHLLFGISTAVSDAATSSLSLIDEFSPGFNSSSGLATQSFTIAMVTGLVTIVQAVVTTLGGSVLQGVVANNVRLETLGHRATARELWAHTRPALGRLLGYGGLVIGFSFAAGIVGAFLGFFVAMLFFGIVSIFISSIAGMVVSMVLVIVAVCIPILWLAARISLAVSVIVFEGTPVWASVRRSWALTRRSAWRIVGLQLVLGLIAGVAIVVLVFLATLITDTVFPFAAWEEGLTPQRFLTAYLAEVPVSLVAAVGTPIAATLCSTVYLDARVRTEWLATSLQNFHAGRAQGYAPAQLADPFVTPPPAPAAQAAQAHWQQAPQQTPPPCGQETPPPYGQQAPTQYGQQAPQQYGQQTPPPYGQQAPQAAPQWEPRPADPADPAAPAAPDPTDPSGSNPTDPSGPNQP